MQANPPPSKSVHRGSTWAAMLGLVIFVFGVLLLTPASDLLPVDLWLFLQRPFGAASHGFVRVVPGDSTSLPAFAISGAALVIVGLALLALSLYLRNRLQSSGSA